jgi:hypothetical protein
MSRQFQVTSSQRSSGRRTRRVLSAAQLLRGFEEAKKRVATQG